MEKLIKIEARRTNGRISKHRTISFIVKAFRNAENDSGGLYVRLNNGYTFVCKSIEVEQKEIEPSLIDKAIKSFDITEKDYKDAGLEYSQS